MYVCNIVCGSTEVRFLLELFSIMRYRFIFMVKVNSRKIDKVKIWKGCGNMEIFGFCWWENELV